jgi:hypothetical protein
MIKKLKYLTSLLALAVVGTGFLTNAEAAVINSVTIVNSDSGDIRGIDSLITVEVSATFTGEPAAAPTYSPAFVWLVVGSDKTAVLTQPGGATSAVTDLIRAAGAAQATPISIGDDATTTDDDDFVGGSGNIAVPEVAPAAAIPAVIDGDVSSVATVTTGTSTKTVVYTIKIKVPPTATSAAGVRVAAAVFDESRTAGEEWTSIACSQASVPLQIDADRPSQVGFAGFDGAAAVSTVGAVEVKGLSTAKDVEVIGIGDKIEIKYDLGNRGDDVILNQTLRLVARFSGKTIELPVDTKKGTFIYEVKEGDFPDLADQGGATEFTFSLFLIDAAGNLSDNDPEEADPAGVTQAVCFLVDATKPSLADLTIALANGDTLTGGSQNAFADGYANTGDAPDWLTRQDSHSLSYQFLEGLDKLQIDFSATSKDLKLSVTIDPVDAHFLDGVAGDLSKNVFAKDVKRALDITTLGKALSDPPSAATDDLSIGFVDPTKVAKADTPVSDTLADQKNNTAAVLTDQVTVTGDNGKDGLSDGIYDITFTATDLAGNASAAKTVTGVCVDVTKPSFGARLFPIGSALETINDETSPVRLQFNEPMSHAEIVYMPIDAAGDPVATGKIRKRVLTASELIKTDEQVIAVDSLDDGVKYRTFIVAQDLKGKIQRSAVDEFKYDKEFVNAVANRFAVTTDFSTVKTVAVPAGTDIKITIKAQDASVDPVLTAVTYDEADVLVKIDRVTGADLATAEAADNGLALIADNSPGVTEVPGAPGHYLLDRDGWANGVRSLVFEDQSANDSFIITIVGPSEVAGSPDINGFVVDADGVQRIFNVIPGAYSKLVLIVPASGSAEQGVAFWVDVHAADSFGNVRLGDSRFVVISSNKIGVIGPTGGEIMLKEGVGGFWAKSPMWNGEGLYFKGRDVIAFEGGTKLGITGGVAIDAADVGGHHIWGQSATMIIIAAGGGGAVLTAVAEVIPLDFLGAKGLGDQGGFVVVHFPSTPEHASLTSYVIWREVLTTVILGADGALQVLDPADAVAVFIPWANVPPYPGVVVNRVVVATLGGDATRYAVSANRGDASTALNPVDDAGDGTGDTDPNPKRAFADASAIASSYELMAQTMVNSKEAAALQDVPVFATLTPEALAFMDKGFVPNLKEVGSAFESVKTISAEAVRDIDNIAPDAVSFIRAIDTPNDAGSSITVNWGKSVSDVAITQTVANAVGANGNTFSTQGVMGYNIYRALGNDGELQLVGKANAGETSFTDFTALNGVRYSYEVVPYDNDNEATTELTSSAMAIRNRVIDRNGQVIVGLFGADNKVGFDDFFMFADHFGLKAVETNYEPAFDLNQDSQINFTDFFIFADNFGRSVDLAGKALPTLAGLNSDARLDVAVADALPRVGEDMIVRVNLADFMEVKGYGFHMSFDPNELEFVKLAPMDNNVLGEGDLAHPQVIAQEDGELSIGAFGDVATEGQLEVNLVFRTKTEIEDGYIELSDGGLLDGNFGLNQVSSLGFVRIETRPEAFALGNNFPNPFNPETTIKYALPEAGSTKLVIYNVVGQVVRHLVAEHQSAGRYVIQWNATNDNGQPLSSGVYFYHLQVGGEFQQVKRMLLLK